MKDSKMPDAFDQWKDSENWIRWTPRRVINRKFLIDMCISVGIGVVFAITIVCLVFSIVKSVCR